MANQDPSFMGDPTPIPDSQASGNGGDSKPGFQPLSGSGPGPNTSTRSEGDVPGSSPDKPAPRFMR